MGIKAKAGTQATENETPTAPPTPPESSEVASIAVVDAPSAPIVVEGLEAGLKALNTQYQTPQVRTVRVTFSLQMTIPTGDYQNLIPKVEQELEIPAGAVVPASNEILAGMRSDICQFMRPLVMSQVTLVDVQKPVDGRTTFRDAVATTLMLKSPLFKWLSVTDREMAREIADERLSLMRKVD